MVTVPVHVKISAPVARAIPGEVAAQVTDKFKIASRVIPEVIAAAALDTVMKSDHCVDWGGGPLGDLPPGPGGLVIMKSDRFVD